MARIRAVMRRNGHSNGSQTAFDYDDGYLKINIEKHRILIGDEPVKLTPVEFRLLVYLVNNAGRVLTFSEILGHAWGNEYKGYNDFVHVYISHLRRKIEVDAKNSRYFLSVHGVGYIFEPQDFKLIVSDDNDKKLLSLYNDVGS
jgi:DNA-binding response OmpR family regulator